MTPNEPNTLNKCFETLNAAEAMKYSSFPREVKDIAEVTKEEGVWIVRNGYFKKDK